MKKGFTMIELIFVIVILGILASVAIPRLASSRTDAEISALAANIRTLISDAAAYYTVKGEFGSTTEWRDVTNVPIRLGNADKTIITDRRYLNQEVYLKAGDENCIVIRLRDKDATTPVACVEIAKVRANKTKGICPEVLAAAPIKAFLDAKVPGVTPIEENDQGQREAGLIAVGSSITIP